MKKKMIMYLKQWRIRDMMPFNVWILITVGLPLLAPLVAIIEEIWYIIAKCGKVKRL